MSVKIGDKTFSNFTILKFIFLVILLCSGGWFIVNGVMGLYEIHQVQEEVGSVIYHYDCENNTCTYNSTNYKIERPDLFPTVEDWRFEFLLIVISAQAGCLFITWGVIALLAMCVLWLWWTRGR